MQTVIAFICSTPRHGTAVDPSQTSLVKLTTELNWHAVAIINVSWLFSRRRCCCCCELLAIITPSFRYCFSPLSVTVPHRLYTCRSPAHTEQLHDSVSEWRASVHFSNKLEPDTTGVVTLSLRLRHLLPELDTAVLKVKHCARRLVKYHNTPSGHLDVQYTFHTRTQLFGYLQTSVQLTL